MAYYQLGGMHQEQGIPDTPHPNQQQLQKPGTRPEHQSQYYQQYGYQYPDYANQYSQYYQSSPYKDQYQYQYQLQYQNQYQYQKYQQAMSQQTFNLPQGYPRPQLPQLAVIKPPKISRNQKRKTKLREKKEELEAQKRQIGAWVKYESKALINEIETLEEQERKKLQKRKNKLGHLVEIGKEVYNLRKKMGVLKAETNNGKLAKILGVSNKKKPSMIKKMNHRYQVLLKGPRPVRVKSEDEGDWQTVEQTKQSDIVQYPVPGKLAGSQFNNIQLRQWVDHLPSDSLEEKTLVFINKLAFQQAIKKVKQPLKWKKRIVAGFNECDRTLRIKQEDKKSRCLFVALNIVRNPLKFASDDRTLAIIDKAKSLNIPIIHVSTRSKLGRAFLGKFGPRLSVLSVINYQGSQQQFQQILEEWRGLQQKYNTG